jgi:hypothetical protein
MPRGWFLEDRGEAFRKAADFRAQHKPGDYKKARLGNTFRWELKELGYSKKFAEIATKGRGVCISRKG